MSQGPFGIKLDRDGNRKAIRVGKARQLSASAILVAALLAAAPANSGDITLSPPAQAEVGKASSDILRSSPHLPAAVESEDSGGTNAEHEAAASSAESPPPETSAEVAEAVSAGPSGTQEIVVTGESGSPPGDPLERVNEASFQAVQAVDESVIAPVAHGYEKAVPKPVRSGVHNFLKNLDEPVVFLNFLLQLKPGKAIETLGRFALNTTIGVAGLIDVAKNKPFHLPRRSNGLANTLGYYGVEPGPYLVLPLIGSTTLRDVFGRVIDLSLVPTIVGRPFNQPSVAISKGIISSIDERVENDDLVTRIRAESPDPYATMREYYQKKRQAEIDVLRGKRENADISLSDILAGQGEDPVDSMRSDTSGAEVTPR